MRILRRICSLLTLAAVISTAATVEGANARAGNVTVPVMTALTVKLDEAINAKTTANGSGFTATIKDPVQVGGVTVIPANSSAGGLVSKEPARGTELLLNSVFVNGRLYRITTSPVSVSQKTALRAGSTFTFNLVLSLNIAK